MVIKAETTHRNRDCWSRQGRRRAYPLRAPNAPRCPPLPPSSDPRGLQHEKESAKYTQPFKHMFHIISCLLFLKIFPRKFLYRGTLAFHFFSLHSDIFYTNNLNLALMKGKNGPQIQSSDRDSNTRTIEHNAVTLASTPWRSPTIRADSV